MSKRLNMVCLVFSFLFFFSPHPPSFSLVLCPSEILGNLWKVATFVFSSAKHYTACCVTGASHVFSLFSSLPKQGEWCECHSEVTSPARDRARIQSPADLRQGPFHYSSAAYTPLVPARSPGFSLSQFTLLGTGILYIQSYTQQS